MPGAGVHLNLTTFVITIMLIHDSYDMVANWSSRLIFYLTFYMLDCDRHLYLSCLDARLFVNYRWQALNIRYFLRVLRQVAILVHRLLLFDRSLGLGRFKNEVRVVCLWQFFLKIGHVLDMIIADHNPLTIGEKYSFHKLSLSFGLCTHDCRINFHGCVHRVVLVQRRVVELICVDSLGYAGV